MIHRLVGQVIKITAERPGAQEILVLPESVERSDASDQSSAEIVPRPAVNIVQLNGMAEVGDRVVLNTCAVEMGLGSGGMDFVLVNLSRLNFEEEPPGHIIKLRYTPMQIPVLAVEAPESSHHDAFRDFDTLEEMPVVCIELHSQLPAVCAAAHWALSECDFGRAPRIAYIMTEGAALPLAYSKLVHQLKQRELITAAITSGQAFGGDYEAVNIYSALAAAKSIVNADMVIVGQGPGNVGTSTRLGFSGIDQGISINAGAALGGIPIAVTRVSFADQRDRHLGLSHHTITVLTRVARASALIPIPRLPFAQRQELISILDETGISQHHQPITVDAERGLAALEAYGIEVTTMGRNTTEERAFFLSSAAGGLLAAQLIEAREISSR